MNKLKFLRIHHKLTQLQLAEKAGLSQAYINELENGKKTNPSLAALLKLSEALDASILELMDRKGRV